VNKARSERLRTRLRAFWAGYDGYLDNPAQEVAGEGSLRVRAASFVSEGSRILDVACGLGTNSVCLAARGEYFGTDISLNFLRHAPRRDLRLACSDGVYVVWTYEVIRQMHEWGWRLIHCEADTPLLGNNALVRFGKRVLMKLRAYRYAGSTVLLVFEKR